MSILFLDKLFGTDSDRYLAKSKVEIGKINEQEPVLAGLTDEELKAQTGKFRERLKNGESLDELLPEAFATVRETAKRVLGQRHYDVQLVGGLALHEGRIAEMKTGEGKTQVATLPAYLNALAGGVHIVTVNDYLARRDAVWMGQIYHFLGLSVGVLNNQASFIYDPAHTSREEDEERDREGSFRVVHEFLRPASRAEVYRADITYGTNNEFGFDYLRDNIAYDPAQVVQVGDQDGKFHFAIIDEVDSILIDEARTPLIISAPSAKSENLYRTFAEIARKMEPEADYTVDEKQKAISLTDDGITKAEKILGVSDIYSEKGIKFVHHLETAVRAKALFELDRDYVVKNGEIIIVDEFTGRLQPGRRWSEGLHQAIEAKEGVEVKEESRTFATITLQNYFRLYRKLAGMTGTAETSAEEFMKVYGLPVVTVPTNKPSQRQDLNDLVFQTENGKFLALTRRVKEVHEKGQPVLVGTSSIEKNELLSAYFKKAGIPHEILNAKNHEREGAIIAEAGKRGSVVLATNMAGRGVDIKLGGPDAGETERAEIRALGGLFVLGTERHEARRIDNQLRGRSGRQGDPGETQFFVSMEDTLMRVFANSGVKSMMGRLGIPEDEPIENRLVSRAIESAQTKIEGLNFDLRKHLLEYDDVMNHQRQTIYERRRKVLFGGAEEVDRFLREMIERLTADEGERARAEEVLAKKKRELGEEQYYSFAKQAILQIMDMHWVEHLEALDYMRGSVRLRAYGQRDPLIEFKREGLSLFRELEAAVANDILNFFENAGGEIVAEKAELEEIHDGAIKLSAGNGQALKERVGRNDPCPCGAVNPETGKVYKYKHCGLINAPQHRP